MVGGNSVSDKLGTLYDSTVVNNSSLKGIKDAGRQSARPINESALKTNSSAIKNKPAVASNKMN